MASTRGSRSPKPLTPAPTCLLGSGRVTWKGAALRLGEELASVGPTGYYAMTPAQWLAWCLAQAKIRA
jgi:hypothetical protein